MQQAYLDNNATTQPAPEVVEAMAYALRERWANPSSVHRAGQQARHEMELAREKLAALLNARPRDVVFTSGATESCNTAMRGILAARADRRTVITTRLEHSAVRETAARLAAEGYRVIYLPVSIDGVVDIDALAAALDEHGGDVAVVSVHWINNETGVIQPIEQIGSLCRERRVPFFADGTQALGKVACDVQSLPVDAMAFSAHKFHGPKGVGGLWVRSRTRLVPQTLGGPHERERRGGTENVPGIVGMGVAAELCAKFLQSDGPERGRALRDRLEAGIVEAAPDAVVISAGAPRLWNTANIGFPRLESEALLVLMSEKGVSAAAGAACSSGSLEPSPVLLAQGIEEKIAHGAVRFSLSRYTTEQEVEHALRIVPEVVGKLQGTMSVN